MTERGAEKGAMVNHSGSTGRIFRFAAFEFHPAIGELRKHGLRVRLNGQPVELLAALIERPGEVITREELEKRLWAADTHVDFEHSLNAAVKRLRGALGDSADSPLFVETIARKGYRFIAPLDVVPAEVVPQQVSARPKSFVWAAVALVLSLGAAFWLQTSGYFWESPIARAHIRAVTDFDGVQQAAAISRDGRFLAFLSDRSGQVDVWVTQVGSGEFHNLTQGKVLDLENPAVRTLGFSPDGSLVTYWTRKQAGVNGEGIGIWAVPTLGGESRPYLEGAAEFDWTRDGSRLVYHTSGPGDPLFVSDGKVRSEDRLIFTARAGLHSHFPIWAEEADSIYFVLGSLPDKLDIWRIPASGGTAERITSHVGRVSHPVLFDRRTLLYLATDPDGSGPWLYSIDINRRVPHRLTSGLDRYTSLSASGDGRRLVVTRTNPKTTLWRLKLGSSLADSSSATRISLPTSSVSSPRLGPDYLLYTSIAGDTANNRESIWKQSHGVDRELWGSVSAHLLGSPAISPDGRQIAFSVAQRGKRLLYIMTSDGLDARVLSDALNLENAPVWAPDQRSITVSAEDHGTPHLFRIPVDGQKPTMLAREYSVDPAWSPDGRFVVYSGPDIGTTFAVKAITNEGTPRLIPTLVLTRGARHLAFLPGGNELLVMRGEIEHKDLWAINLETGAERQLTRLGADFELRDFDISAYGGELILERVQEHSDVVLLDLPGR